MDNNYTPKNNTNYVTEQTLMKLLKGMQMSDNAKSSPPGQGKSRSAKQRRNRKMRSNDLSSGPVALQTSGSAQTLLFGNNRGRKSQLGKNVMISTRITPAGLRFLKAAFASPDGPDAGAFDGIPDEKSYQCLPYRHVLVSDLFAILGNVLRDYRAPAPTEPSDLLIVQSPIPGYAFHFCFVPSGDDIHHDTIFYPVAYSDFESVFTVPPNATDGDVNKSVTAFRCASNSIELICTSNAMTWQGSIICFKSKLSYSDCATYTQGTDPDIRTFAKNITGLEAFNNKGSVSSYFAPSNLGVYASALNADVNFPTSAIPDNFVDINGSDPKSTGVLRGRFTGFGSLESTFIRVQGVIGAGGISNTSFTVRSWSQVEYTCVPSSLAANAQRLSPELDIAALEIYKQLVAELPVAVQYADNDTFWKRVLEVLGKVGNFVAPFLGSYGFLANAAGGVASGVSSLLK